MINVATVFYVLGSIAFFLFIIIALGANPSLF